MNILEIILFDYLLLDLSAKRGPKLSMGLKNSRGERAPYPLLPAPMGPPLGVILIQQCSKRHCYAAANKPCRRFLKAHFFSFFFQANGWC